MARSNRSPEYPCDVGQDGSFNARTSRNSSTRKAKIVSGGDKTVKPKFAEERTAKQLVILPKTENQKLAIQHLKTKQVVVLRNTLGTGKTFLACTHAANAYLRGEIDKIVILRPYEPVSGSKTMGFTSGNIETKMMYLVQTLLADIELVVGKGEFDYMLEHQLLVVESLEFVRGRSYKRSCVILDEAQNANVATMQAMLGRIEDDSQLILCGDDVGQKDIKEASGMTWLVRMLDKVKQTRPDYLDTDDMNQVFENIGVVNFTTDDIVRSGITKFFAKVFNNYKEQ